MKAIQIPLRYWGLLSLCLLSLAYMAMFRYDSFGIDEGAARALLINWSIAHQVASPIALFGIPDFRALLFVPLNLHWVGSLVAAKMFTLYLLLGTALLLHRWSSWQQGEESALLATGLFLLCPLTAMQVDAIAVGPYLLACFVAAYWIDGLYRESRHLLASYYFIHILLAALAVSMHPAGLAYPLALAWHWHESGEGKKKRSLMIGLPLATFFTLLVRHGWPELDFFVNPLPSLGAMIAGWEVLSSPPTWPWGLLLAVIALLLLPGFIKRHKRDLFAKCMILALLLGLFAADQAWAFLAGTFILFAGIPAAIALNQRFGWRGFLGQRGLVLLLLVFLASTFMINDRHYMEAHRQGVLDDVDRLISILAEDAADPSQPFLAASQWPGRTMLACKRDVLPLPPAGGDAEDLKRSLGQVTHLIFNPNLARNKPLARQLAQLSETFETVEIQSAGVILKRRKFSYTGSDRS